MLRFLLGYLAVTFGLCYIMITPGCTITFQNISSVGSIDDITDDLETNADIKPVLEVPLI